jgi:hypothetical protein
LVRGERGRRPEPLDDSGNLVRGERGLRPRPLDDRAALLCYGEPLDDGKNWREQIKLNNNYNLKKISIKLFPVYPQVKIWFLQLK